MNKFFNIPNEIKGYPQWVVWRYVDNGRAKPDKEPFSPLQPNRHASVIDPTTWASFDEAIKCLAEHGFDGIGFVFTENDPFAFVDFDDTHGDQTLYSRQLTIYSEFGATYSERSPSGNGIHIICKGAIPQGRKRFGIELYSQKRFGTFTGDRYGNATVIENRHELLNQLYNQLGGISRDGSYIEGDEQKETDEIIIDRARNAVNGPRFLDLFAGRWKEQGYASQSEADFAFIDIIGFYTQNREQIRRIFATSALGKTPKGAWKERHARVDYVEHMINRAFDNLAPKIDISQLSRDIDSVIGPPKASDGTQIEMFGASEAEPEPNAITVPPGLLGDIARYVYDSSPRPVPEIALASAIALMSGICGRAYNVSGTGINQYLLLLAGTGTGKEASTAAISRLLHAIRHNVPDAMRFLGPTKLPSESGLIKFLANKSQCFVSCIGEFGYFLQELNSRHAQQHVQNIRRMMLDLYNKSGAGQILGESAYSDSEKSTSVIMSPAVTFFGESTQETVFDAFDERMINDGLLPRFLVMEYAGELPEYNRNHAHVFPSYQLVNDLATLAGHCLAMMHRQQVVNVDFNKEASKEFDKLLAFCDTQIRKGEREAVKSLWSRVHVKAMKLAAILAIGVNPHAPVVTGEHAEWAVNIVRSGTDNIVRRFRLGHVGKNTEEGQQYLRLMQSLKQYVTDTNTYVKYGISHKLYEARIIPFLYISRRLTGDAVYRKDKVGPSFAIKRNVQRLVDDGTLKELSKHETDSKYGFGGKCYMISDIETVLKTEESTYGR